MIYTPPQPPPPPIPSPPQPPTPAYVIHVENVYYVKKLDSLPGWLELGFDRGQLHMRSWHMKIPAHAADTSVHIVDPITAILSGAVTPQELGCSTEMQAVFNLLKGVALHGQQSSSV